MKLSMRRRLDKLDQKQQEKEKRRAPRGPGAKRYFDDFEVRTVLGANGKPRREFIYIGDTFTALVPEPVYQRRKRRYFALALLCTVIFVAANSVNVSSNRQGLLGGLGILMVIPLFLVVYSCACRRYHRGHPADLVCQLVRRPEPDGSDGLPGDQLHVCPGDRYLHRHCQLPV